jgi:hypothetical protein
MDRGRLEFLEVRRSYKFDYTYSGYGEVPGSFIA